MYLSRRHFEVPGYTDACVGCRDIASGKQRRGSFLSPHNLACRRRMEEAIRSANPDRWERYLLRQREEESAAEKATGPEEPRTQVESKEVRSDAPQPSDQEVDDEAEYLSSDLDEEDLPTVGVGSMRSPSAWVDPRTCEGVHLDGGAVHASSAG